MIEFNQAVFAGNELDYLAQSISAGHVSGNGPLTKAVEAVLVSGHDDAAALLTTSCTHALEMAALLCDISPGDEVIVPSYTFVTTASAFLLHGATPVFVDVREDTLNLDVDEVRRHITPRTKAVCVVHYGGVGAEPDKLAQLCDDRGLVLIEDNAHGLFGSYAGRTLGTFGALSTLSFHETKNITCGEGGALIINRPDLLDRAEILREKGTNRARFFRGQVDKYTWVDVGSSWVPSDMLAGVLLGQLERFDLIQEHRHHVWNRYADELRDWAAATGVRLPDVPAEAAHTAHLFHLRLPSLDERHRFIDHMGQHGVRTVFHYQALHLSTVGQRLGGRPGQCPVSEQAADTLVRLPLHAGLSEADLDTVIRHVRSFDAGAP